MSIYDNNPDAWKTTHTDEFDRYMKALCRLASEYVSRIRVQFAEKAYDMYQNETIRSVVLAYGEEAEKLDADRNWSFRHVMEYGATSPEFLNDTCLNNARHYAATIKMLFDID